MRPLLRPPHLLLPSALLSIFTALAAQGNPQGDPAGGVASGGGPPATPHPAEVEVLALGCKELSDYAALCAGKGFPRRARELWFEVIGEYDPDDAAARRGLGYSRFGKVWKLDPEFDEAPADALDPKQAKSLTRRFEALARTLARAHLDVAAALVAAGNDARASYHHRRALRFAPTEPEVIAACGLQQFDGLVGTESELQMVRRSRVMDRAIMEQLQREIGVEAIAGDHPVLQKLDGTFLGVKTEHFSVYGDWDEPVLQEAARWAERSLAFCEAAFDGHLRPAPEGRLRRTFVFFRNRPTFVRLLETNVRTVGVEQAQFLAANASAGLIGEIHAAGFPHVETVYDLAVRWVVHDYTGFRTDALRAGIGHAVVAMFFGRNLVFAVGRENPQHTVAARTKAKLLLPDLDTWMELATELAWSRTAMTAARLPLLEAASFPTEGRIKAWSFCDYLLRRDPQLLHHLDRTGDKAKTEPQVHQAFAELAHRPLAALDAGWRTFWTEDSQVRRAILDRTTPLESVSRDAARWLEAFNQARAELGRRPVGWSSGLSDDCRQHVHYLLENRDQRDAAALHTQLPGRPGYSNAGRTFAQTAVVAAARSPKKAIAGWLDLPGYRDALLNPNVDAVGIYAERGVMVLDARRGRIPAETAWNVTFPIPGTGNQTVTPVPRSVDVGDLGPEVARLLVSKDRGGQKKVGYPLTAHLYFGKLGNVRCKVTASGQPVEGWLVPGCGSNGRTSAEGLWVFYPAEPLPKGIPVTVEWTWDDGGSKTTFTAR